MMVMFGLGVGNVLWMVELAVDSNRPETAAFAASLANLCDGPLLFRNLDMLREEDL